MHLPVTLAFDLRRAGLALLGAMSLAVAALNAQPTAVFALPNCNVPEPPPTCDPIGPTGTLTSISRVPAGVKVHVSLAIRVPLPTTLYGYIVGGPVTTVTASTRSLDVTI